MKGLPEQGQEVAVVALSGATIPARVKDIDERSALLTFERHPTNPVPELAGGHVAIQYTNRRGICRIDGQAHKEPEWGVLRVDYTDKVKLIQRREYVRVHAMVRVTYKAVGIAEPVETTTVNVSGGGFMISGREGLRMYDLMDFTVDLDGDGPDAGPLEVTGRVMRETPGGLGIRIERIEDEERERLIRWVFGRERLSRQIVGKPNG
jgi:hypothetical protein